MKKILIIDDSAFMRNILKDILTENAEGKTLKDEVEIFEADGKVNALQIMQNMKPDIILLDIVMRESEKEGVEFLGEIHQSFDVKKVIIVSSIGQTAILDALQNYGVVNYLQKPFEYKEVIQTVNKVISEA